TRDCDLTEEYPLLDVPLDGKQWAAARELDQKLGALRRQEHESFWRLAGGQKLWHALVAEKTTATGSAELHVRETDGQSEIVAEGTLSANSQYTAEFPFTQFSGIEAIKIEVLPKDLEAALKTPETGFMLSQLRAYVVGMKNGSPREI